MFTDPFENGLGLWTIINNGGTCDWEIFTPPYPNTYTLPATSSGGVLAADSDECGSGTTMNTTAEITQVLDLTSYDVVTIEFDNDWNEAMVIGHNPVLSYFVEYLTGHHFDGMAAGSLVKISCGVDDWALVTNENSSFEYYVSPDDYAIDS